MGRSPEFEIDDILGKAMGVFWANGYRDTSMTDLENATSLRPGSIYHAFGSKKGLFLAALDHYVKQVVDTRVSHLLEIDNPMEAIEDFFRSTFEAFNPDQLIGCMLTNTATEVGATDSDIQERIEAGLSRIEGAFESRLTEAQGKNLLAADKNAKTLALHLVSCYQGLAVIGRLTRDKDRLRVISDQALASLK
ncbi:MAG: TetR/AcrR family transcriptional regulator [Stappiaceae bacterium]